MPHLMNTLVKFRNDGKFSEKKSLFRKFHNRLRNIARFLRLEKAKDAVNRLIGGLIDFLRRFKIQKQPVFNLSKTSKTAFCKPKTRNSPKKINRK